MTMHEDWNRFLADTVPAAIVGDTTSRDDGGLEAARDGVFLCDLSGFGLASVVGPDAETFLQGQLSNDVKALSQEQAQLAAYNTPKGRMLASLLLWRCEGGYLLQCPASIAEAFVKRLSMFVLRSKVRIENASTRYVRFGIGGPKAPECLSACAMPRPEGPFAVVSDGTKGAPDERHVIGLPGPRYEFVYADVAAAIRDWQTLAAISTVAAAGPWRWLGVRNGIAEIESSTQDKYVPQMLNLELVGGISFTKGCYPGQEIVARTQYRGEIKRRMFLAHAPTQAPPSLGQDVVVAKDGAHTVGSVVDFAPAPEGGYDILVCLHLDLAHNAVLRLEAPDGPELEIQSLPYSLPQVL
jgi:folate-binding protein YgfZ